MKYIRYISNIYVQANVFSDLCNTEERSEKTVYCTVLLLYCTVLTINSVNFVDLNFIAQEILPNILRKEKRVRRKEKY
jgi:hypothetical protein